MRERRNEEYRQPKVTQCEAREDGKWASPEKDYTSVGRKQTPEEYVGEIHSYPGVASSNLGNKAEIRQRSMPF